MDPPAAPEGSNLAPLWDGKPLEFGSKVTYKCTDVEVHKKSSHFMVHVSNYFV